ncbi:MAG: tetratricopeptide repeat protein [Dysgonamonadaceae bacterium]|jgi:tetratricopeptide (TPR) repeat protein|nr:tetratricopeptide repeat protein [Dysgonamonadaceae bacterium]
MKTNMNFYAGDPNVAVRQILESSEEYGMCYEQRERLKKAIYKLPEGSPERREKLEELNSHSRRSRQMTDSVKQMYEMFSTFPLSSPRMAEAERCFLNGDFTGMDNALPEEEITAEAHQLKQELEEYNDNWEQTERLLREKSYELVLKSLLHYTHTDNPEWYRNFWNSINEALDASENAHTLYCNGWYCVMYGYLDRSEEFYTDATDERWMEEDLSKESKLFFEARCTRQLGYLHFIQNNLPAAIYTSQRALRLFTKLQDINPAAYSSFVADVLATLGDYHMRSEAYSVALVEFEEALRIRRQLAVDNNEGYLPLVAESLNLTGVAHTMKGEARDAIACYEEAIAIERNYLEYNRMVFMDMLATALSNMATAYFMLGKYEKIIPLLQEIIELHRELAVIEPENHLPGLAHALCQIAGQRRLWKEYEESYRSIMEAIAIYRECALRSPSEYLPKLAERLSELDGWCREDGKYAEAIEACRERVDVYRRLAEESFETYMPQLGEALNGLATIYNDIFHDREKALAAASEAYIILKALCRQNPACEESYNKAADIIRALE